MIDFLFQACDLTLFLFYFTIIWCAALTNMSVNRSIIVVSHWVQWIVCGSGRCKSSSVAFKWDGGKIHYDQTLHLCAKIRVYTLIYRIEEPGIYWMSFYESITDNQHVLLTSNGVVMHKSFTNSLCFELGYHGYLQ